MLFDSSILSDVCSRSRSWQRRYSLGDSCRQRNLYIYNLPWACLSKACLLELHPARSLAPDSLDYTHDCSVGAATTMVTELLQAECAEAGVQLSEAESTLFALGIHADTGEAARR